jgi:hypothetical protein
MDKFPGSDAWLLPTSRKCAEKWGAGLSVAARQRWNDQNEGLVQPKVEKRCSERSHARIFRAWAYNVFKNHRDLSCLVI